jgi:amino acid transporter
VLLRNLGQLTALVIFCGMIYNFLTVIAVIIYRRKFPDLERPYKVWGYPFTVILAAAVYAFLAVETFMNDPVTAIIGCVVPAISLIVYFLGNFLEKRSEQLITTGAAEK